MLLGKDVSTEMCFFDMFEDQIAATVAGMWGVQEIPAATDNAITV
jgi:hypothetical protein